MFFFRAEIDKQNITKKISLKGKTHFQVPLYQIIVITDTHVSSRRHWQLSGKYEIWKSILEYKYKVGTDVIAFMKLRFFEWVKEKESWDTKSNFTYFFNVSTCSTFFRMLGTQTRMKKFPCCMFPACFLTSSEKPQ